MVLDCPYCKTRCNFKPIWAAFNDLNMVEFSGNRFRPGSQNTVVMQCDNIGCKSYVLIFTNVSGNITSIYPFPILAEQKLQGIPDDVWIDYFEACKCFEIKAYNATVVMLRRALQNIAIDKGAKKSDDLYTQLEELKNKDIIQGILYDVSKHIRTIGNDGAHPEKTKVIEEDAMEIKDFTWQIIDYVYLLPDRVNKLQTRKQKP